MSLQDYSVAWSPGLVSRVETHLRDIHSTIHQYYEEEGYPTRVVERGANSGTSGVDTAKHAATAAEEGADAPAAGAADVVSPAGSFLHRTCVHALPFTNLHAERGVGVDLVITMPTDVCGLAEVQDGLYLERRQQFLECIEAYLRRVVHSAASTMAAAKAKDVAAKRRSRKDSGSDADEAEDSGDDEHEKKDAANMATAERLSRMVIIRMPIHGCYANGDKEMLRLRFLRRPSSESHDDGFHQHCTHETFYVDLHFRPVDSSGRVMSAAATRKHPYYSYLILEDYMMPSYLKKIHAMCVEAGGLRRALVILKSWAHHIGLMASASGHPEGLNGFLLACMLLKLREDGIISNTTTEENAARTVWIRLSHGYFLPPAATAATNNGKSNSDSIRNAGMTTGTVVPAAEERGQVAVLRLSGEVMNVLFRSSVDFFRNVVQRAAEEALTHAVVTDVFAHTPFQMLRLRYDVALTVTNALPAMEEGEGEIEEGTGKPARASNDGEGGATATNPVSIRRRWDHTVLRKASVYMSPLVLQVRERCTAALNTALRYRAKFTSAWPTGPNTVEVIVQLSSETEGRHHLTRGPPIEDAEAVAAFDTFWGVEATSTRQFPDGAIYRCVLWRFPETVSGCATSMLSASTVIRRIVEFALRRHLSAETSVSVFLGGLEGFLAERVGAEWRDAAQVMQKSLREASLEVQKVIADLPRAVLPCKITEFGVISASERNTEVFPVRPHLALTRMTDNLEEECFTGLSTAPTIEPIHCVMAIDDKGKIPDTLEAIGLMKGAISAQLAKYMHHRQSRREDKEKRNTDASADAGVRNPTTAIQAFASSQSVDLICRGYLFRVHIAHYREVSLLRALQREVEANLLERKLFWAVQHAKFARSIVYGHHSYANAVRLAKRWVGAMLMADFVAPEAVELLVANAYLGEVGSSTSTATTGNTSMVMGAPRTAVGGFLRFIQLLATHDWQQPLILPFTDDVKDPATAARKLLRRADEHQAMYIATPYAPTESPFTLSTPRPMILHRLVQLAKGLLTLLVMHRSPRPVCVPAGAARGGALADVVVANRDDVDDVDEMDAMAAIERAMFTSDSVAFDFAMAFHPQLILQPDRCITVGDAIDAAAVGAGGGGGGGGGADGGVTGCIGGSGAADLGGSGGSGVDSANNTSTAASKTVVRIRQLDELDRNQSREYVNALVEREPAAYAVRTIRAALRDKGMVFYDALAPTAIFVVSVTATPVPSKSREMHDEIMRVGRGALLPAPPRTFAYLAASATGKVRQQQQQQLSHGDAKHPGTAVKTHSRPHTKKNAKPTNATAAQPKGGANGKGEMASKRQRTERATPAPTAADVTPRLRVKAAPMVSGKKNKHKGSV